MRLHRCKGVKCLHRDYNQFARLELTILRLVSIKKYMIHAEIIVSLTK